MRGAVSTKLKLFAVIVVAATTLVGFLEFCHNYNHSHLFSYGLHVDVLAKESSIGIPGQKMLYRAELTNYTFLPVRLTACDFQTDTLNDETEYPYGIQRWDESSQVWQTVLEPNDTNFCRPVPLGVANPKTVSHWIWPLMTVDVMGWESTGARVPFVKGDRARFVVFRRVGKAADWSTAVQSSSFSIEDDVDRSNGVSFRVAH
jgi:hypothetical protein